RRDNRRASPTASHCRGDALQTLEGTLGAVATRCTEVIAPDDLAQLPGKTIALTPTERLGAANGSIDRVREHPIRLGDVAVQAADELALLLDRGQLGCPERRLAAG